MPDTFKEFLSKWFTPITVSCIVGGIIWGVQLNQAVVNLTESLAKQHELSERLEMEHRVFELAIAKTTIIQEALLKELGIARDAIEDHNRESAEWKRRIIRNEEAVKNGLKR